MRFSHRWLVTVRGLGGARPRPLPLLLVGALWNVDAAQAQTAVPLPDADTSFQAALPTLDQAASPPVSAVPSLSETAPLQAPLSPLADFNPTPPAAGTAAAAKERPDQLRYEVEVTGLKQIDLESRFRGLSGLLHDGSKAANVTQIRARAEEDRLLAERLLHSEGYLDGIATAAVPASSPPGKPVPVTIAATPGPLYRLRTITLTGLDAEPRTLASDALALKPGDPIAAQPVEDAEAHISLRLPEHGYPFVKLGQRDILLETATPVGDYTLPVSSGPKSSFGKLRTAGDAVFALDHLQVFPRFDAGELYDSRKVDDLRQALVGTSLFSTVAVEPVRTDTIAPDGTEVVDLLVRQARGKAHTLSAGAGYGTGEGLKIVGEYQNRNWSPPEGALILDATAGTQQQAVGAIFRRSNAGKRDRTFQAAANVSRNRYDAYNAETIDLSANISRQSTPIWQKRWTYSVGAELIGTRETPFDAADLTRPRSTYYIAALPLQAGYDRSNSLLDPTHGFRLNAKFSPEAQQRDGGGFDGYARMLLEGSVYLPLTSESFVLAGRARVGSIQGAPRDDIAPSRRLYSGGGGSVRGFGYQELGPKDANNDPIGGRSLTEFALEARYRFGNYGVVPFFDAGRVGTSSVPSLSGMRYGVGIGARYYTNFGPFRLDVATPLGRRPGESKVAVYISIGQAF